MVNDERESVRVGVLKCFQSHSETSSQRDFTASTFFNTTTTFNIVAPHTGRGGGGSDSHSRCDQC